MGNVVSFYKEYDNWRSLTKTHTSRIYEINDRIDEINVEIDKIKVDVKMLYSNNV